MKLSEYSDQYSYIERIRAYCESLDRKLKYYTKSFGCQQNESDTEKINGILESLGYVRSDSPDDADFVLFNTCAVREHAETRVYGQIGALVSIKRKNPDCIIAICGCMMQRPGVSDVIRQKYRHVSIVFGTFAMDRLPGHICSVLFDGKRVFDTEESKKVISEDIPVKRSSSYKAWVTVMYGCNNFCSYCIVPYVRGRERSRDPECIISEVKELVSKGYKDITLLGQNVNSYGVGSDFSCTFAELLRRINDIDGDFRIRFMTSHPKDASRELIDAIADCDKVCKHIHLPFQSGSSTVLKQMNRKYTRESYLELIKYIKERIPDIELTSDVIVGFPGETDDDFEETMSLVREVGFGGLFTFIYSIRPGTPAAKMPQVDDEIKHAHFDRLLELQNNNSLINNRKYVGKTVRVLSDGYTDDTCTLQSGRTDGNIIVNFRCNENTEGKFVNILIEDAKNWAVFGSIKE